MLHTSRYVNTMYPVIDKFVASITSDEHQYQLLVNVPDHLAEDRESLCIALQAIFLEEVERAERSIPTMVITIGNIKGTRVNYINEEEPGKEKYVHFEEGGVDNIDVTLRSWGNS